MIRRVVTEEVVRARLANLYNDAREAANAREEVLKIVSHDLRNPLHTISMAVELMLETPLNEEQRIKNLKMIHRSGERMNRLIHDLLDVAKLEAGRMAIATASTKVQTLLDDAAELLSPIAAEAGISLQTNAGDNLPDIWVDRDRMLQVFSNLGGNAIKFTPKGGQITLIASRQADHIRMCVCDTGPGIPPEAVQQIFAPFWQAQRSDKRGLGLGLSIARSIVEAHGGRIGVDSTVGAGCEFWFTIPSTQAATASTANATGNP
jgi:signal transduction histidine kinase